MFVDGLEINTWNRATVKEVKSGTECGIGVLNYKDVQPGDQIEVFERIERARTL